MAAPKHSSRRAVSHAVRDPENPRRALRFRSQLCPSPEFGKRGLHATLYRFGCAEGSEGRVACAPRVRLHTCRAIEEGFKITRSNFPCPKRDTKSLISSGFRPPAETETAVSTTGFSPPYWTALRLQPHCVAAQTNWLRQSPHVAAELNLSTDHQGWTWTRHKGNTVAPFALVALVAFREHPLGANNPLAQAILKRIVLLAFLNMSSDSRADDFGDWSAIDGRNHVQFLRLVGGQANRHRLDSFHEWIVVLGIVVVHAYGIVVSINSECAQTQLQGGTANDFRE